MEEKGKLEEEEHRNRKKLKKKKVKRACRRDASDREGTSEGKERKNSLDREDRSVAVRRKKGDYSECLKRN